MLAPGNRLYLALVFWAATVTGRSAETLAMQPLTCGRSAFSVETVTMNILLTNVLVRGRYLCEDGITDVMVFCDSLPAETLAAAYRAEGSVSFDECYEVPDDDVSFYLYEPCYLTKQEEARARELAAVQVEVVT